MRLNCEGSATSSRRVRDTRDDFATILRGILSHKIFEHVQNFRDYFAPLGDTCEEITNHWRLFRDCFASHSRCLSPAVAKQSQSSEIGALLYRVFISRSNAYFEDFAEDLKLVGNNKNSKALIHVPMFLIFLSHIFQCIFDENTTTLVETLTVGT